MQRDRVVRFLDELLAVGSIPDFGPQGLLVEGKSEVTKVAVGVTPSIALFEKAIEERSDLVICHHGMFLDWESRVIRGPLKRRLELLFDHGITLLSYHLVLDAHEEHGNNALIARELALRDVEPFGEYRGTRIGRKGRLDPPLSHDELGRRLRETFGGDPLVFGFGPDPVRSIGVISGGAVSDFQQAIDEGLDAYLTGEVKEHVQEMAREAGVTYVAAGHYRTETFGVRSLGERLEREFGLPWVFVDVPNPV
ncbi:MAG: Nif3-like dinuclear metal center hexameric protein [Gemmatimonadetes bacterium]|nr:Nif3-like dinuclear metal center hexameric protein [Gemmatimonadota bacterium]